MQKIPTSSVDMILCDLPYGQTRNQWDIELPFAELWAQYKRIIKDNGAICLFADGLFMARLMLSEPKLWRYNIVWDKVLKSGFLNANKMPLRQHEEICVFYKKLPTYNPQFTQGKPLHGMGSKYKENQLANNNYRDFASHRNPSADRAGDTRKHPASIVTYQKPHPSKAIHPTEKPVQLLEYLVKTYTNPGDTVLDNCMGSGSTGVACVNTGRRFIGIEKDENHFAAASDRIERQRLTRNAKQ